MLIIWLSFFLQYVCQRLAYGVVADLRRLCTICIVVASYLFLFVLLSFAIAGAT
jgi:hypothetical protein